MCGAGERKKLIVVSDGDLNAWRAARRAVAELGLGLVDCSGGNPTRVSLAEVLGEIAAEPYSIVVVLADDGGAPGLGPGERLIEQLAACGEVEIVAAVAVASWAYQDSQIVVDESVTAAGVVVRGAVDKEGRPLRGRRLRGDTVGVLDDLDVPIIGVGDIGVEDHACDERILRLALVEAMRLSGVAVAPERVEEPAQ